MKFAALDDTKLDEEMKSSSVPSLLNIYDAQTEPERRRLRRRKFFCKKQNKTLMKCSSSVLQHLPLLPPPPSDVTF